MNFVNRAAIVVRPKEPFFDWARSLEGGVPENTKPWSSVYLVDRDAKDDAKKIVSRNYSAIFEEQLEGWLRVPDEWPAPRTLALFEKWFDAQVADLVLDLSYRPLRHDE